MEIPKEARYAFATNTAYEFLIDNRLSSIPSIIDLARSKGFVVLSFKELCESIGWNDQKLNKLRQSGSAISSNINGTYHIWYNELTKYNNLKSAGELRFDLAHELGHIELGHLRDFLLPTDKLSGSVSLENEANCFARNLIEPVQFISIPALKKFGGNAYASKVIQTLFNVTLQAATFRCQDWIIKSDLSYILKENRSRIIDILTPRRDLIRYYKRCEKCRTEFTDKNLNFCSICGGTKFEIYSANNFFKIHSERGKNKMKYPGVEVDDKGKVLECPCCENEEIPENGDYCDQCATYLINKCTNDNCEMILKGNQRYCPSCGCTSTFLSNKILKPWKEVYNELTGNEVATTDQPEFVDPFVSDPKPIDVDDDDLPF